MGRSRKVDEFLDLYRRLETAAEKLTGKDNRRGTAVFKLASRREFEDIREELDCCREVRNLLSHEIKVNGAYAVEPNDNTLEFLRGVVERVENPPMVRDRATPVDRLLVTDLDAPLLPLMTKMNENNFSHAPLLKNGIVTGVFSVATIFHAVLMNGGVVIDGNTKVGDFSEYLPLLNHLGQTFDFISVNAPISKARSVFDKAYHRSHKLQMLFVTRSGLGDEPLLGVLTPYDML